MCRRCSVSSAGGAAGSTGAITGQRPRTCSGGTGKAGGISSGTSLQGGTRTGHAGPPQTSGQPCSQRWNPLPAGPTRYPVRKWKPARFSSMHGTGGSCAPSTRRNRPSAGIRIPGSGGSGDTARGPARPRRRDPALSCLFQPFPAIFRAVSRSTRFDASSSSMSPRS